MFYVKRNSGWRRSKWHYYVPTRSRVLTTEKRPKISQDLPKCRGRASRYNMQDCGFVKSTCSEEEEAVTPVQIQIDSSGVRSTRGASQGPPTRRWQCLSRLFYMWLQPSKKYGYQTSDLRDEKKWKFRSHLTQSHFWLPMPHLILVTTEILIFFNIRWY